MKYFEYHNKYESAFKKRSELTSTILEEDESSTFPSEVDDYLKEGVLRNFIPKELGGDFHNLLQILIMGRSLARRNITGAIAIGQSFLGSLPIWFEGTKVQKEAQSKVLSEAHASCLALTEIEHGSDLSASQCEILHGKLNGKKWCINNATLGHSMTLLCKDQGGLSFVYIRKDKKNFVNLQKLKTHGIRGADISGIDFFDYPVSLDDIVGKQGRALELVSKTMQISRTLCASFSLGASDATLRDTIHFCFNRKLYNQKVIHLQSVRCLLSKALTKSLVCEALAISSTRMASLHPELMPLYSSVVKSFIPSQIDEQIRICAEILGARFYLRESDYPLFQKNLRDHSVVSLFDGSLGVNLALLAPILNKLKILKNSKEAVTLEKLNILSNIDDVDFSKFKLGVRSFDFVINAFFNFEDQDKYFTYNSLIERYEELCENPSNDMSLRNDATEFIKVFSCMNFMLFSHVNKVLDFYKDSSVIDQMIMSILDESSVISFSDDVFSFYENHLVSLFEMEINE